jgi:hypothetical protein
MKYTSDPLRNVNEKSDSGCLGCLISYLFWLLLIIGIIGGIASLLEELYDTYRVGGVLIFVAFLIAFIWLIIWGREKAEANRAHATAHKIYEDIKANVRSTSSAAISSEKRYYQTLGLNPGASSEEIKEAFRRLAKQYHPDLAQTQEERTRREEQFKRINEAYEYLKRKPVSESERISPQDEPLLEMIFMICLGCRLSDVVYLRRMSVRILSELWLIPELSKKMSQRIQPWLSIYIYSIDCLIYALSDKDKSVRKAALKSLINLTGYNFGRNPSLWRVWYNQKIRI